MRKKFIFALSILLVLLLFGVSQFYLAKGYRQQLEATYQRAFREFALSIGGMEEVLLRTQVARSWYQHEIAHTQLQGLILRAQGALGQLPMSTLALVNMESFLSELNNQIYQFEKLEGVTEAYEEQIARLHESLRALTTNLQHTLYHTGKNDSWVGWMRIFQARVLYQEEVLPSIRNPLMYSLVAMDRAWEKEALPLQEENAKQEQKEVITKEEALRIAKEFLSYDARGEVFPSEGDPPTYTVRFSAPREVTVEVDRQGRVLWMLAPERMGTSRLSKSEAIEKAEEYLSLRGFTPLLWVYEKEEEDTLELVFAPKEEGVLILPQKIRIKMALDTGDVLRVITRDYYANKKPREEILLFSEMEEGEFGPSRRVVFAEGRGEEFLAYELSADYEGEPFRIYIHAHTGREERILRAEDAYLYVR